MNDAWASHCPVITIISNPVVESIPLPKPDCMCRSYMNHTVACTFFCHSALRLDNLDADIADYLVAHSIRPPLNARETIAVAARVMYTESDHSWPQPLRAIYSEQRQWTLTIYVPFIDRPVCGCCWTYCHRGINATMARCDILASVRHVTYHCCFHRITLKWMPSHLRTGGGTNTKGSNRTCSHRGNPIRKQAILKHAWIE